MSSRVYRSNGEPSICPGPVGVVGDSIIGFLSLKVERLESNGEERFLDRRPFIDPTRPLLPTDGRFGDPRKFDAESFFDSDRRSGFPSFEPFEPERGRMSPMSCSFSKIVDAEGMVEYRWNLRKSKGSEEGGDEEEGLNHKERLCAACIVVMSPFTATLCG